MAATLGWPDSPTTIGEEHGDGDSQLGELPSPTYYRFQSTPPPLGAERYQC